ncbi:LCP family protein [Halalkalibacter alkalisediminis]|uniref:Regulatory protein MsrR n=1 Tax=Halalkalibacter alkalisediminis TaxID=935616 RepID=A0ABV6NA99_9BACI|nr:LCP family protein [Halalkalibacter alkalisediminis]
MSTRKRIRRKNKKSVIKKLFISTIIAIALILFTIGSYVYLQYEAGKSLSENQLSEASETPTIPKKHSTKKILSTNEPENNAPINVLLVGVDKLNNGLARTDTIMIAQYNPLNGDSKVASIMRDSYVEVPGRSNNKINASFAFGGVDLLRETIRHNFGLDIHYYALINFEGFIHLVDTIAPNGITVLTEEQMYDPNNSIKFQPGEHVLDGVNTLNYVRFRKDRENDFGRVRRQQEVLNLLKNELFTLSGISKIPKLTGMIEPHLDTNIQTSKLLSLGRDVVLNPIDEIKTLRIPIDGSFKDAYYQHAGSVLQMDLEENQKAIQEFFSN